MHDVAVLALDGVAPFDLGVPSLVFCSARGLDGAPLYRVEMCAETPRVRGMNFDHYAPHGLERLATADTVIVPGGESMDRPFSEPVLQALRQAAARGARIASICTGAFALGAAGLLDGRRATTHWSAVVAFAQRFPQVHVDPDVLFVDEEAVVTAAGASAGIDMCLHLVRRDFGQAVAAHAARMAVAPLDRDGGQAQFIHREPPTSRDSLAPLLEWMSANCTEPLDVGALASRARLSVRTLARRFRDQTGTTPLQWLLAARIRRAQELLETTPQSIEAVAAAAGFESAAAFRASFQRRVGLGPSDYRRRFNAGGAPLLGRPRRSRDLALHQGENWLKTDAICHSGH
jgi:transcriptional regulator GlxA family with amidase domain